MPTQVLPPLRKRVKRRLRSWLLRAVIRGCSFLPLPIALALGRGLGSLAFRLARRPRLLALKHLELAYPEATPLERATIVRGVFVGLGEHLLENICIRRVDAKLDHWVKLDTQSKHILDEAYGSGRGVIIATGHIGNWELAARALAAWGYPVAALARRSHDAGLGAIVERFRTTSGIQVLYRGEPGNVKQMLRELRAGRSLVMLVDQDLDVPSVYVPFFGRPARTARGPVELALRSGAHLLVGWIHREAPAQGHSIFIREINTAPPTTPEAAAARTDKREQKEAATAELQRLTAQISQLLEDAIREAPSQWVWFHRRWYRPPTQGKRAAPASDR